MAKLDDAVHSLRLGARGARLAAMSGAVALGYRAARPFLPANTLERRTKRELGRAVLSGAGFSWSVFGSIPNDRRPRLVVANHRSAFDIALMLAIAPDPVMVARADLAEWPLFGALAKDGDTLFVDRTDRAAGARAIREMRSVLERGRTLVVFPEGTTHAEPDVRAFQGGAFAAAKGLDVEVVPVGIAYAKGLEFVQPSMAAHVNHVLRAPKLSMVATVGAPTALERRPASELATAIRARVASLASVAEAKVR